MTLPAPLFCPGWQAGRTVSGPPSAGAPCRREAHREARGRFCAAALCADLNSWRFRTWRARRCAAPRAQGGVSAARGRPALRRRGCNRARAPGTRPGGRARASGQGGQEFAGSGPARLPEVPQETEPSSAGAMLPGEDIRKRAMLAAYPRMRPRGPWRHRNGHGGLRHTNRRAPSTVLCWPRAELRAPRRSGGGPIFLLTKDEINLLRRSAHSWRTSAAQRAARTRLATGVSGRGRRGPDTSLRRGRRCSERCPKTACAEASPSCRAARRASCRAATRHGRRSSVPDDQARAALRRRGGAAAAGSETRRRGRDAVRGFRRGRRRRRG